MWAIQRWRWVPLAALGVWGGVSCLDLPAITRDECGNGFVEEHEDCDTKLGRLGKTCGDTSETCRCYRPHEVNACRWYCDDAAECVTVAKDDDESWGCGTDHVCR